MATVAAMGVLSIAGVAAAQDTQSASMPSASAPQAQTTTVNQDQSPAASASSAASAPPASSPGANPIVDYFENWSSRVAQARATQPHWMPPIATTTPILLQAYRYDQSWQSAGNGTSQDNSGGGKGLEFIPTETTEIILAPPPYIDKTGKGAAAGLSDWQFLTVKKRLASANEQDGNYIVTAFFSVQAPTGITAFTNHAWVVTPTLAAGKGWGNFDIQATVGVPIPLSDERVIGTSVVTNVTFQEHVLGVLWPELEVNSTYWADGVRGGKNQVFLTPGMMVGPFPVGGGAKFMVGLGYQIAVSPTLTTQPVLTPMYNHAFILSTRVSF